MLPAFSFVRAAELERSASAGRTAYLIFKEATTFSNAGRKSARLVWS